MEADDEQAERCENRSGARRASREDDAIGTSKPWLLREGRLNRTVLKQLIGITKKDVERVSTDSRIHKQYFQLAGHSTGKNGGQRRVIVEPHYVLKLLDASNDREWMKSQQELNFYKEFYETAHATVHPNVIPAFYGTTTIGKAIYLKLENIYSNLVHFQTTDICFADIKIGPARTNLARVLPEFVPQRMPQLKSTLDRAYIRSFVPVLDDSGMQVLGMKVWNTKKNRMVRYGHRAGYGAKWVGNQFLMSKYFESIRGNKDHLLLVIKEIREDLLEILRYIETASKYKFYGSSVMLAYSRTAINDDAIVTYSGETQRRPTLSSLFSSSSLFTSFTSPAHSASQISLSSNSLNQSSTLTRNRQQSADKFDTNSDTRTSSQNSLGLPHSAIFSHTSSITLKQQDSVTDNMTDHSKCSSSKFHKVHGSTEEIVSIDSGLSSRPERSKTGQMSGDSLATLSTEERALDDALRKTRKFGIARLIDFNNVMAVPHADDATPHQISDPDSARGIQHLIECIDKVLFTLQ